jgi:hypothetical protein
MDGPSRIFFVAKRVTDLQKGVGETAESLDGCGDLTHFSRVLYGNSGSRAVTSENL